MSKSRRISMSAAAIGILSLALAGCGTQSNGSITATTKTTNSTVSGSEDASNTANSRANNATANNASNSTADTASQNSTLDSTHKTKKQSTKTTTPVLMHMAMINATVGYANGPKGIYKTIDGGSSWKDITPPNVQTGNNEQITVYPQKMYVWASQSSFNQKQIKLFYRRYTGQTWHTATIQNKGYVQGLHVDGNFGYFWIDQGAAAGSSAIAIYGTTNGGKTWHMISQTTNQNVPNQIPFGGDKSGVTFINPQHGWVSGFVPVNGQIYLVQTTNGGKTWHPENVPVPKAYAHSQIGASPPVFFNSKTGIFHAIADTTKGSVLLVYKTNDGGMHWKLDSTLQATSANSNFRFFNFLSATNWIINEGNNIYKTSNGGGLWKAIHPNKSFKNISQMQFINANIGWLKTNSGTIFETTNGGQTWKTKSH